MTTLRTAAQQVLEKLEQLNSSLRLLDCYRAFDAEITALNAALEQPEQERGTVALEREKVAHWMCSLGYATGHGDTIEDLLDHLGTQIAERLLMEREACADLAEQGTGGAMQTKALHICLAERKRIAAAIRTRGQA